MLASISYTIHAVTTVCKFFCDLFYIVLIVGGENDPLTLSITNSKWTVFQWISLQSFPYLLLMTNSESSMLSYTRTSIAYLTLSYFLSKWDLTPSTTFTGALHPKLL